MLIDMYQPSCTQLSIPLRLTILLYNVRSIHNVGSIFRYANALGVVDSIILIGITPAPYDRFGRLRLDFHKTSLGSERDIVWKSVPQFDDALSLLDATTTTIACEQSPRSYCLFSDRTRTMVRQVMNKGAIALTLGCETTGIPHDILEKHDYTIEIPMNGTKESLNVAIAGAILAYFLYEQASRGDI